MIQKRINLFMPIFKSNSNASNKYYAVLTDDSIDREDEIMDEQAFKYIVNSQQILPALMDHENKCMNLVAKWTNHQIKKINGNHSLISQPEWIESNPNTQIIRGMLDEGAPMGISIGAIPKKSITKNINGKNYRAYTEIELVEASFTPVPANQNAKIIALAKSIQFEEEIEIKNKTEVKKMEQPPEQNNQTNPRDAMNGVATGSYGAQANEIMAEMLRQMQQVMTNMANSVSEYKTITEELVELKKSMITEKTQREKELEILKNVELGKTEGNSEKKCDTKKSETEEPKEDSEQKPESEEENKKENKKSVSDLLDMIQK